MCQFLVINLAIYTAGPLLGSDSESEDALGEDGPEGEEDEFGSDEEVLSEEEDTKELPVELKSRKLDKAR